MTTYIPSQNRNRGLSAYPDRPAPQRRVGRNHRVVTVGTTPTILLPNNDFRYAILFSPPASPAGAYYGWLFGIDPADANSGVVMKDGMQPLFVRADEWG